MRAFPGTVSPDGPVILVHHRFLSRYRVRVIDTLSDDVEEQFPAWAPDEGASAAWAPWRRRFCHSLPEAGRHLTALHCVGYWVFRGSNSEKDAFRRDPSGPAVAHLKSMTTKRGTRLLVSGWWGTARKINYTGDWMMGLAWCLCCGGVTPLAYFYAIYFAVRPPPTALALAVARHSRADDYCSAVCPG